MKKQVSKNTRQTAKNSGIFSFFTMISRVLGLLRDMLKAHVFGTGIASVAFDIAFRLPNMLRNLVAEGALSQAFVPIYQEYANQENAKEERLASGNVLGVFFLLLGSLSLLVMATMPYLLPLLMSDVNALQEVTLLAIPLAQILFPYILLMSLTSIYMSIQYSYKNFVAASFGPALLNLVILILFSIYYFLVYPHRNLQTLRSQESIYVFSAITLFAAFLQLLFQVHAVKKMNCLPIWGFQFSHPVVKKLFVMMLPAVFAASVQELGQLIDIALAAKLYKEVPEAVSALTYGHRLIQLPLGIFAVAIATASLPQLSEIFLKKDKQEFSEALLDALSLNLFLLIPATLGLMFFAIPIVGVIFEHGEFTRRSTEVTAQAVFYYSPGIIAFGMQKLFINSLYARHNSKIPAWITFFTLIVNVGLSLYFMKFLFHAGLALSTSLSAFFAISIYFILYARSKMFFIRKQQIFNLLKMVCINFLFGFSLFIIQKFFVSYSYIFQVMLILPLALFYVFLAFAFRLQEWFLLKEMLIKIKQRVF